MNETVREWLAKADADYATADRELKAILIDRGVVPSRTHDIERLSATLGSVVSGCSWNVEDLRFLTRAAVAFRYPGEADREDAGRPLEIAAALRAQLRPLLLG